MSGQEDPPSEQGPVSAAGRVYLRTAWLDQREREAGLREKRLDEREHDADQREGLADDREGLANERESQANLREKRLDERELSLSELQWQMASTISRTRALLAADQQHRHPPQAVGPALAGYVQGGQAEAGDGFADSERLTAILAGLRQQIEQSQTLRRQAVAVIGALAATEERIARQHDRLAALSAKNADKYRRFAADARAAAQRARAILRNRH
ncbi:MAG: hypothetical protein ACM3ML_16065 [Micromonosporaceae bacterium]